MTHYELVRWLKDNGWTLTKMYGNLETWVKGEYTRQLRALTKYPKTIKENFNV